VGQLFAGGSTNPNTALIDPSSGQATYVGSPSQVLAKANAGLQAAGMDQSKLDQLPFIGRPTLQQAAQAGAMPGGVNATSPGLSKLWKLGVLLTSGVQGALAGRAAQEQAIIASGGRRAGGVGTGFEAGYTLPFLRAQQQQQVQKGGLENQLTAADIGQKRAQTELTERQAGLIGQSVPITLPNGQQIFVPANQAGGLLGNIYKGSAAAQTNAQSRLTSDQFKARLQQGEIAFVRPGSDPQTGQFGMLGYNKQGDFIGHLPGAIDPATLPTTNTSQQWLETSPGVWSLVDKTSTTQKGVPSAQPQGGNAPGTNLPPFLSRAQAQPQGQATAPSAASAPRPANTRQPRQIFGGSPIFAFDPQANERVLTTPAEAAQRGYTNPVAVKEGEIDKYTTAQKQFNDVQSNLSRFTAAARDYSQLPASVALKDQALFNSIMNNAGAFDLKVKIGEGGDVQVPGLSALLEGLSRETRSASYGSLSPQGKALVDGYYRTMAAVPAYEKGLTGIGKFNKEIMELELANIPNPTMAPGDILRKLQAFQENVDQGASGIPRMPGIPTLSDTRRRFEGSPSTRNTPSAPQPAMNLPAFLSRIGVPVR
jgi:hypothetical protein